MVWKPSEKTPLTALACQALFEKAAEKFGKAPKGLSEIVLGLRDLGEKMVDDLLCDGHDWADDHISVAKENIS